MGRGTGDPLATVVLTRRTEDNAPLTARLEGAGLRVIDYPCVAIAWRDPDGPEIEACLARPPVAMIFPSRNAVEGFFRWRATHPDFRDRPRPALVGAVGPRTAAALEAFGWGADLVAEPATGEELARRLAPRLKPGDRVCSVRGDLSRDASRPGLEAAGMRVIGLTVYANRAPDCVPLTENADVAVFASPSAADRFFTCNPTRSVRHCVAIGSTTADWLTTQGLRPVVADKTDTESLYRAVCRALAGDGIVPADHT